MSEMTCQAMRQGRAGTSVFASEAGTGSRQERAIKQRPEAAFRVCGHSSSGIDRRDFVSGLAAAAATLAIPASPARSMIVSGPHPTFFRFIGPIISNPAPRQCEDEALMRILCRGYWFVAREGDDILAIRHSDTGLIFEKVPQENGQFAVGAIAIEAGKPMPDAEELARIGHAACFAAINTRRLCRVRGCEGSVFVQYPAAGGLGEPIVSASLAPG